MKREDIVMADIIGTTLRDTLRGVDDGLDDLIFSDTDFRLSSGRGADDLILAAASDVTTAFGDADILEGTGRDGHAAAAGAARPAARQRGTSRERRWLQAAGQHGADGRRRCVHPRRARRT